MFNGYEKKRQLDGELLSNIKSKLPSLESLLQEITSYWSYEDSIYRFYHQSYKVYGIQKETKKIIDALKSIAPGTDGFCCDFQEIVDAGTNKEFRISHNKNWTVHTRALLEAFFHAKYFLEMAVKYGKELEKTPDILPSGWAALLCLYNFR